MTCARCRSCSIAPLDPLLSSRGNSSAAASPEPHGRCCCCCCCCCVCWRVGWTGRARRVASMMPLSPSPADQMFSSTPSVRSTRTTGPAAAPSLPAPGLAPAAAEGGAASGRWWRRAQSTMGRMRSSSCWCASPSGMAMPCSSTRCRASTRSAMRSRAVTMVPSRSWGRTSSRSLSRRRACCVMSCLMLPSTATGLWNAEEEMPSCSTARRSHSTPEMMVEGEMSRSGCTIRKLRSRSTTVRCRAPPAPAPAASWLCPVSVPKTCTRSPLLSSHSDHGAHTVSRPSHPVTWCCTRASLLCPSADSCTSSTR